MWSPTIPMLAAAALAASAIPAAAQGFHGVEPYGPAYGSDDGYAGAFVQGRYIGAPLTQVPRPSQIVPSPWNYGTYGIPTVAGIAATPAGQPTLIVINAGGSKAALRGDAASAGRGGSTGARIIAVQVPRR